jgi:hypothetical protein
MERFITLCREFAAAATDDPELATELIAMANAIALGMQARAVPPIIPRMHNRWGWGRFQKPRSKACPDAAVGY